MVMVVSISAQRRCERTVSMLLVASSLIGCVGLTMPLSAKGNNRVNSESAQMPGTHIRISVGDSEQSVLSALGPPNSEKFLKNSQPNLMGKKLLEYNYVNQIVNMIHESHRIKAFSIQFIFNNSGSIIRILENPNRYHATQPRTLLGSPFLAETIEIPSDPLQRQRHK